MDIASEAAKRVRVVIGMIEQFAETDEPQRDFQYEIVNEVLEDIARELQAASSEVR